MTGRKQGLLDRSDAEMQAFLEDAYDRFARPSFVENDPLRVVRAFAHRPDAEVIGLLTATIAWGQRTTIIANAERLVQLMEGTPHDFVMHAGHKELERMATFAHRTFNGTDLQFFIAALRNLYRVHGSLESAFLPACAGMGDDHATSDQPQPMNDWNALHGITLFRERFFSIPHPARSTKHVADPSRGSHAKRLNMFLRWMVRPADRGIDLGIWTRISPAQLMVPLDVHTGRVARELGLLHRKQDDRTSVEELTSALRRSDPADPVKYDIALFALGVNAGRTSTTGRPKQVSRHR